MVASDAPGTVAKPTRFRVSRSIGCRSPGVAFLKNQADDTKKCCRPFPFEPLRQGLRYGGWLDNFGNCFLCSDGALRAVGQLKP
jgi:hypothetical protein